MRVTNDNAVSEEKEVLMVGPGPSAAVPRRPTMRDVAALAGVSLKTVSRVINAEPGVAPSTVEKVTAAAAALHFVPDSTAANLARGGRGSQSIALLIASVDDPFSAAVFRGVEEVALTRHVAVFASSTEGRPLAETDLVRAYASRNVDGMIITPTVQDHRPIAEMLASHMPCVYIDRDPVGITADVVTSENRLAGRRAVEHLLEHGHRRIGLITDEPSISTAAERELGYRDAILAAGLAVDERLIARGVVTEALGEVAAWGLFGQPQPPTAVFAARNMASIGAVRVLRQAGLADEVAIVGMDDIELSDLIEPPLTIMRQNPVAMGRLAASRLFARLDGDDSPPRRLLVPTELVVRGSGEIRPG